MKSVFEQIMEKAQKAKEAKDIYFMYEVKGEFQMAHYLGQLTATEWHDLFDVIMNDCLSNPSWLIEDFTSAQYTLSEIAQKTRQLEQQGSVPQIAHFLNELGYMKDNYLYPESEIQAIINKLGNALFINHIHQ